uniref:Uncharacterized protein n=1 Tax=Nelumbo nucifera TaxID=4432 RepID=A0A822ZI25_NELNU|nr:TPA_asm: hypothetical protein HUJ06_001345 [Nelumbo nucifera]
MTIIVRKISLTLDKLDFICSCAIDSVEEGGPVLVPIGCLGIILQLLEQISQSLESSNLNRSVNCLFLTSKLV